MGKGIFVIFILLLIIAFFILFTYRPTSCPVTKTEVTQYVRDILKNTTHKKGLSADLVDQKNDVIMRNLDLIHVANLESYTNKQGFSNVTYAANKFIPYTYEEFIQLFTGLLIPDSYANPLNNVRIQNDISGQRISGYEIDFDKIPSTAGRRDIFYGISPKLLGKPQDQGTCGSCWAFSACNVLGAQATKGFTTEEPIEVDTQYYLNCVKQNFGCDGGFPIYVYDFVANEKQLILKGDTSEYIQEQKTCITPEQNQKLPVNVKGIIGFGLDTAKYFTKDAPIAEVEKYRSVVLNVPSDELLEKIKKILFNYGPLTVLLFVDEKLPYLASGIYLATDRKDGKIMLPNHAVVISGYGMDLDGDDYWICQNSWGKDWADAGYFQLSTKSPISGITIPIIGDEPPVKK